MGCRWGSVQGWTTTTTITSRYVSQGGAVSGVAAAVGMLLNSFCFSPVAVVLDGFQPVAVVLDGFGRGD